MLTQWNVQTVFYTFPVYFSRKNQTDSQGHKWTQAHIDQYDFLAISTSKAHPVRFLDFWLKLQNGL